MRMDGCVATGPHPLRRAPPAVYEPPTRMLLHRTFTFIPPAALALALSSVAAAQTRTFHDAAGRVTGKATTRNGVTTFYDSADTSFQTEETAVPEIRCGAFL